MNLPLEPPVAPMEARTVAALPAGDDLLFEPKWDGFRCVAFRDGDEVYLQSKAGQPLARYFPEVEAALAALSAQRFVVDGELVVPVADALDFDQLLQRIHPAASRVKMLAREYPATLLLFDLLVDTDGTDATALPLVERRARLERFAAAHLARNPRVTLSPATRSRADAQEWLAGAGGATDGVVAKRVDAAYLAGERSAMFKVKRMRTADCVIGGYRPGADGRSLGSLLLGLYDEAGDLHYVGFTSGLAAEEKAHLAARLEALRTSASFTGRAPGGPSRWSRGKDTRWIPVRPSIVLEVEFDHVTGERFRHGTRPLRFRPDKAPQQCTMDQLRVPAPSWRTVQPWAP